MPDDVLLSHGETPHYHRRRAVSLLSSEWDQVVPARYGRQAKREVKGKKGDASSYMAKPNGQLVRVS